MLHLLLAIIYLAFISLGLPDALLGSAWPIMHLDLGVDLDYAGIISMTIAGGTIISSLMSDRLNRKLGTGKVTLVSVALTALALFGFSISGSFWMLVLWAIPYGLGAGSVDAALNNYVALHYSSRHMSWLHCMWGVGAAAGPSSMGYALTNGQGWNQGYRYIVFIQVALSLVLFFSLPLWKKQPTTVMDAEGNEVPTRALTLAETIKIPGAKAVMLTFFSYCAIEQTAGLWASSYLVLHRGVHPEQAAGWASLFFLGITAGRALNGFLTFRFHDRTLIRAGEAVIVLGILVLWLPLGGVSDLAGLILIGLGCAPIYPSVIHSTPEYFGAERTSAIIGVQMASAYVGILIMPPLFGLIANYINISLLPVYLLGMTAVMLGMHEKLVSIKLINGDSQ